MENNVKLIFDFDIQLYEDEIRMKGYCNNVIVVLGNNKKYKLCFYDPIRLQQDIEDEDFIAEVGLIIINEISLVNMTKVVNKLSNINFFESLNPIAEN